MKQTELRNVSKKGIFDIPCYQLGKPMRPAGKRFVKLGEKGRACKVRRIKVNGEYGEILFLETNYPVYPLEK